MGYINPICEKCENNFWKVEVTYPQQAEDDGRKVVAFIDALTYRVIYCDDEAPYYQGVREVIDKKLKELYETNAFWFEIAEQGGLPSLHLKTENGEMSAEAEPAGITGADYDAIYTGISFLKDPEVYVDLISAHSRKEGVNLYVWDDIFDEDWQDKREIPRNKIEDLIDLCKN